MIGSIRKLVRFFVPVVSSDSRRILEAVASRLTGVEGEKLLSQIEYVEGKPNRHSRTIQYRVSADAPRLECPPGIHKLAVVDMCYYQQAMHFTVLLNDGLLFKIESGIPSPLEKPAAEYSILNVSLF